MSLGARGAHLEEKKKKSVFLCWREKALANGAWPGSPSDTRAWRRKHRVGCQGGKQRSGMHRARPHPSSRSCCWVCSCWGLVAGFWLEQRRPSGSFFCSLQHCLGAWSQSCREDRNERGQWLGDVRGKSKARSFQPLASNELGATKFYTMSLSNLNPLVSSVCSEHGNQFIPFLFIKGFFCIKRNSFPHGQLSVGYTIPQSFSVGNGCKFWLSLFLPSWSTLFLKRHSQM